MNQDTSKMNNFLEALKMTEDTNKMYEFLEALNMGGPPESTTRKKTGSDTRDKKIDSPSHKGSKKCNDQCVDCFSIFCHK